MRVLHFMIAASCLLFTTQFFGGTAWTVLCLFVLLVQGLTDRHVKTLAVVVPSLFWLFLSRATDDRELFFPYSMYLAAHVSLLPCDRAFCLGWFGGALAVAVFLAVRFLQDATWHVLAVELGVAAAILAFVLLAYAFSPGNIASRVVVAAGASLLAYVCLAI